MLTRLKSLELHGYKTFASRAVFEFPGRITAIVGPNGSGKSNVSDALRWVLGEQSYSLLRGRKTEDMIFAGSEHRQRAGMAGAVLTFNNEDGWLPIDFAEVSVARRAYRDGNNEYLINGQRVRLKEVAELLGQSGLAERTYTIIGQGLVDAALSLKPDERRRFFEEAAGIGLYRSRREESLHRLDTTRRNLERVQDILNELGPRLRSLERQAQRAMEYERIQNDLRVLMRDWYGYHWRRVQADLVHAQQVLNVQEDRLRHSQERLGRAEAELSARRARLAELRGQVNAWHAELSSLHMQIERVSRSVAVLEERLLAADEREKAIQNEIARLEEEQKSHQLRRQELAEEAGRLRSEVNEAQAQLDEARRSLEARKGEREGVEAALKELRREQVKVETQQVQRRAHHQELSHRIDTLCRTQANLQASLKASEGQQEAAQEKLTATRVQQAAAEVDLAEYEQQAHEFRSEAGVLERQLRDIQGERNRLAGEESRLRAQLSVLEQAEGALTGMNAGAKQLLKAAQSGKLKAGLQALSSQIVVPAEYETAVAAALGDQLDALLAEGQDAEPVLAFLEQQAEGRATFIQQGWVADHDALNVPADEDIITTADRLIQAAAEWQPVLRQLLGQVVVIRSRGSARRVLSKLPLSARVVTLSGEVFTQTGAVTAGKETRAGMVARPRQRIELQGALQAVGEQIHRLEERQRELEGQRSRQQTEQLSLEQKIRQASLKLSQANKAVQQASLAFEQAQQKHLFQRGQLDQVEEQIRTARAEQESLAAEMEKLAAALSANGSRIRERSSELHQLPVDELQAQAVHWSTAAAVASRAVKEADRRLEEHMLLEQENQRRQVASRGRLVETQQAATGLAEERQDHRLKEGELQKAIEALQVRTQPADDELRAIERAYDDAQGVYQSAQQALAVTDRQATQAQLEHSRERDQLDHLRRRIEEDFGLVALEYTQEVAGPTPLPLDGFVEELPAVASLSGDIEGNINRMRAQLRRMGAVNPEAHREYIEVKERHDFLSSQLVDLRRADEDLREVIAELDSLMRREFRRTFEAVANEFKHMFSRLFGGGSARLIQTDEDNPAETGIDIEARLPGRREQGLSLLSGGERSLTAVALIFSLLKVSPTPFCVLDEVDAMLDEANVGRFTELLSELSETTQFIVITHNRNTVQVADVIYGITMGKDSASQMISLRLDEVSEELVG